MMCYQHLFDNRVISFWRNDIGIKQIIFKWFHFTLTRMALILKKCKITNGGKDEEKLELSHFMGINIKFCSPFGKPAVSQNFSHRVIIWPRYMPNRAENICSFKTYIRIFTATFFWYPQSRSNPDAHQLMNE